MLLFYQNSLIYTTATPSLDYVWVQQFSIIIEIFCYQKYSKWCHPKFQVGYLKNSIQNSIGGDGKWVGLEKWDDGYIANDEGCNCQRRCCYSISF